MHDIAKCIFEKLSDSIDRASFISINSDRYRCLNLHRAYHSITKSFDNFSWKKDDADIFLGGEVVPRQFYIDQSNQLSMPAIYDLYSRSGTLRMLGIDRINAKLLDLKSNFEGVFKTPIHINSYLTPADAGGVGKHYDDHDVIILQLSGEKYWKVWQPESAAPTQVRTVPGTALVIPHGLYHSTETANRASCHLTLGLGAKSAGALEILQSKGHIASRRSVIYSLDQIDAGAQLVGPVNIEASQIKLNEYFQKKGKGDHFLLSEYVIDDLLFRSATNSIQNMQKGTLKILAKSRAISAINARHLAFC